MCNMCAYVCVRVCVQIFFSCVVCTHCLNRCLDRREFLLLMITCLWGMCALRFRVTGALEAERGRTWRPNAVFTLLALGGRARASLPALPSSLHTYAAFSGLFVLAFIRGSLFASILTLLSRACLCLYTT